MVNQTTSGTENTSNHLNWERENNRLTEQLPYCSNVLTRKLRNTFLGFWPHDGVFSVGVVETQSVANLVDRGKQQALWSTPKSTLLGPFLVVVKMDSPFPRGISVRYHASFAIENGCAARFKRSSRMPFLAKTDCISQENKRKTVS